jgi:hypothetical protein
MTILNYAHHQNVAGGYDTIDKVRTFAVAQGWVQNLWLTGNSWNMNSPYGFTITDADGCMVELSSSGYGSQSLEVRIAHQIRSACSTHYLFLNMTTGDDYSLQQMHPWAQNAKTAVNITSLYSDRMGMNVGTATYDDLWIFGDDTFVMAVLSMDGVFCQQFFFGSMHMFVDDPTEGDCRGLHMVASTTSADCPLWSHWDESTGWAAHWPAFRTIYATSRHPAFDIYWDGGSSITPINAFSLGCNLWLRDDFNDTSPTPAYLQGAGDSQTGAVPFMNLGECLKANSFSNKRPMLRMVYFGKRSADSVWEPICKTPYYFLNTAGLSIGEQLTYGTETFLCFPIGPYYSPIGIGMQIA